MQINKAELLAITVKPEQYPKPGPPEIAFAGRSNVGKSSLLNLLTNQKKLAYVSGNPGKTRTINFYSINGGSLRIVDLPGYGYARVSKSESKKWGPMVENYLESRETLRCVVMLVDIRHEPSKMDVQMYEYLSYNNLVGPVIATKADKVSRTVMPRHIKQIKDVLGMDEKDVVIPVSALKKTGLSELTEEISRWI